MSTKAQNKALESDNYLSLLLNENSSFTVGEAYRTARTNIGFMLTDEGCKCICVTSPSPSEGKTTTCLNLAITFGMTGARVLLIDADLRRPLVHKAFGLSQKPGVTNILAGFCQIKEGINKSSYKNLDIITAGDIPPNPAELLSSKRMVQLIDVLKEHYDYIFFDCPPTNIVTDAMLISQYMSGVILVARQRHTTTDTMAKALEGLNFAGAKILGFIFNDVAVSASSYKYGSKYKHKYGYYYGKQRYGYNSDIKETDKNISRNEKLEL